MRSPIPLRPITATEHDAFLAVAAAAMGRAPVDDAGRWVHGLSLELDRTVAAFDGDDMVGVGQAVSFSMSVPGGDDVATCGLKSIGVLPTHRRLGLLRSMMDTLLAGARHRGEALSILWPTESAIYPRFGYAPATAACAYTLPSGGADHPPAAFLPGVDAGAGRARLVPAAKAVDTVRPVYDRLRRARPGMWDRTEPWWQRWAHDPSGAQQTVVVESGGGGEAGPAGVEAYARYSVRADWGPSGPANELSIHELAALTPGGAAAVWRYLLDIDLVARVTAWHVPIDDPLPWLLAPARRLDRRVRDGVWLRVLDIPAALSARRYSVPVSVVLEVEGGDGGTFRLDGDRDGASCTAATAAPDVVLERTALAAAYLGGWSLADLAAAGRVRATSPAVLAQVDAAFRWHPQPWAVTWF